MQRGVMREGVREEAAAVAAAPNGSDFQSRGGGAGAPGAVAPFTHTLSER
jgi:hypothetical protein|eukprot:COSAG01_NODE_1972_length_8757_cov_109.482559_2_plen_50_part_00